MRIYLRATYRAALRMFHTGSAEEVKRLEAQNGAVLASVYHDLEDGRYDYAYVRQGKLITLYTRNPTGTHVRRTSFYYAEDGELIPQSHHIFKDAAEMAAVEFFPHGAYINIFSLKR